MKESLERVSLPIEAVLWRKIVEYPKAASLFSRRPLGITLIGTDAQLSLAREVLQTHPSAQVNVIEINSQIVRTAKNNNPFPEKIRIFNDDILRFNPGEISPQEIVIAKHLIHFDDPLILVIKATQLLAPEGLFFASTPRFILSSLVSWKLRNNNLQFDKQVIHSGWGGTTLFIFNNSAVAAKEPSRRLSSKRALPTPP